MPGLHGREFLGNVMQRNYMAVPGLREPERFREPVKTPVSGAGKDLITTITIRIPAISYGYIK